MRHFTKGLCAGLAFALALAPGLAGAGTCRIALALGLDVSRSVNAQDYAIQRDGLIAALTDPSVRQAFLGGSAPVALAIYEWSGQDDQRLIFPWRLIERDADLNAAALALQPLQRPEKPQSTALGAALRYGGALMQEAPPECQAHVLDISGDGRNNDGAEPEVIYRRYDFGALTVNGLAIGEHERDLPKYFERYLIRGPGAFVEKAPSHADFPAAIRRKIIRELVPQLSALPQAHAGRPS